MFTGTFYFCFRSVWYGVKKRFIGLKCVILGEKLSIMLGLDSFVLDVVVSGF